MFYINVSALLFYEFNITYFIENENDFITFFKTKSLLNMLYYFGSFKT